MGDSKVLPILGGVALFFFSLLIVLVLLLSVLSGLDTAEAQCAQAAQEQSLFGYPTDEHKIDVEWTSPAPNFPGHQGYDFKVDEGSKVYASMDGKVIQASGDEVRIRREDVETRYKYLKTITATVGADVKRGDVIGTSGTGDESGVMGLTGPHLHWEMWVNKAEKKGEEDWSTQKPDKNPFELDSSDSGGSGCTCGDLSGANNQQKAFNYFVQNGYTKEQAAGIVGNMISESGVEPGRKQGTNPGTVTKVADVLGFSGGWGIVQWTPAAKMINPSRDAGVADDTIASLEYQLDFLHKQLLGKGPLSEKAAGDAVKRATTVEEAAVAFGGEFERFAGHEDPNNPRYDERKANARHVLSTFGGSAPAGGSGGDTGGCGAGSGNIAEVAKNLAWPNDDKSHWGTDGSLAKPEFRDALKKYNDPNGDRAYTDCGRFVSTVMHMSGADPKYPEVGTDVQRTYLESSGKYDWWHGEPPGGMKPGDILNGPGHTYLYVGPWGDGNAYNAASGSLGDHVPEAGHLYGVGGQFTVYRLKNAPQPKS